MGLRGPKPKGELPWYKTVAELMINEFMNFSVAAQAAGQKFTTSAEEREHEYSPAFRSLLQGLHMQFFVEMGDHPQIGKAYVKGVCVTAIRKLAESDQWEKVAIPLKQLSDVLGLTKEVADQPVIGTVTQAKIDELKAEIAAEEQKEKQLEKATKDILEGKPN